MEGEPPGGEGTRPAPRPAGTSRRSAGGGRRRRGEDASGAVAELAAGWRSDPELGRLAARFLAASTREAREAAIVEAVVADHLRRHGCALRVELPTPSGRSCDFEASRDGLSIYVHVKRLRGLGRSRLLQVPARLQALERIRRPYVVAVRWREGLSASQRRRLVHEAASFIQSAQLGEESLMHDAEGREIGACRILARSEGDTVRVVIGLPASFADDVPRVQKLLRKAYRQFMPGGTNVIMIAGQAQDERDVETALLGSMVERWDRFPRRGERVAHGRAPDGFWHGRSYDQSKAVVWFVPDEHAGIAQARLWIREGAQLPEAERTLLTELFDLPPQSRA